MFSRLRGKTVLITGASSGIGKACAEEYAKSGAHLILAARRSERLAEIKSNFKVKYPESRVHCLSLDVTARSNVFNEINGLPAEWKGIDVLINNAGLAVGLDPVESVPSEAIDSMIDTNVKGI